MEARAQPDVAPELLRVERDGPILHLRLNRPAKRNAVNDGLILAIDRAFTGIPAEVRCIVISGEGQHFCAASQISSLGMRLRPSLASESTVNITSPILRSR